MYHKVKNFNNFINESYSDLSHYDFKDEYDEIFVKYALNEYPIHMSDRERKEASKIYGNRDVGIVYHGGKINSKEFYNNLKKLKSGDTIKVEYMSATPYYDEAESFAMYVKSYDELTMMYALKDAIERGSAGEFGSYVITLKPKPEQVIFSTFGQGEKPTTAAETECVLYGDIEVLDVKIYERLTKDNYKQEFEKMSLESYFNDFIPRWMFKHKIPRPDSNWIVKWVLGKIKTEDDAIKFIQDLRNKRGFIFKYIDFEEFKQNKILFGLLDKIEFYNNWFVFMFDKSDKDNKNLNPLINIIPNLKTYIWEENSEFLFQYYNDLLKKPAKMDIEERNILGKYEFKFDQISNRLFTTAEKLKEIGIDVKIHPELKNFESKLNNILKDLILNKHIDDVEATDIEQIEYFFNEIHTRLKKVLPHMEKTILKQALSYYFNNFAHRFKIKDQNDKNKLLKYKDSLEDAFKVMSMV